MPKLRAGETFLQKAFPISQLRFHGDRVIIWNNDYLLGPAGRRALCRHLGISFGYFERLTPELRADLLHYHVKIGDYYRSCFTDANSTMLTCGGEFLDVVRGDLVALKTEDVIAAVQGGAGKAAAGLRVYSDALVEGGWQIDLLSQEKTIAVRGGDDLFAGLRLRHAPGGSPATAVESFIFRKVCRNSLSRMECAQHKVPHIRRLERSRPDAQALQCDQVRNLAEGIWRQLDDKLHTIKGLCEQPFPFADMKRFLQQGGGYSKPLMARLQLAWAEEGSEHTAYGALNALTRLATHHDELSAWQKGKLQRLAGMFAAHHTSICKHCLSFLHRQEP